MNIRDQIKVNGVQYRLQPRRCGKAGCKCNTPGQEHGPYWYAYSDHHAPKYIGAKLPEHVTKHLELLKANGPKLKALKAKLTKQRQDAQQAVWKADRELGALGALEQGEYASSEILKSLGLATLNGHGE